MPPRPLRLDAATSRRRGAMLHQVGRSGSRLGARRLVLRSSVLPRRRVDGLPEPRDSQSVILRGRVQRAHLLRRPGCGWSPGRLDASASGARRARCRWRRFAGVRRDHARVRLGLHRSTHARRFRVPQVGLSQLLAGLQPADEVSQFGDAFRCACCALRGLGHAPSSNGRRDCWVLHRLSRPRPRELGEPPLAVTCQPIWADSGWFIRPRPQLPRIGSIEVRRRVRLLTGLVVQAIRWLTWVVRRERELGEPGQLRLCP